MSSIIKTQSPLNYYFSFSNIAFLFLVPLIAGALDFALLSLVVVIN